MVISESALLRAIKEDYKGQGYTVARRQTRDDDGDVTADVMVLDSAGGWVYAWEVREPTRLPEPVALSTLGIDHAPQSWRYLGTDACTILEVAARGSSAR